MTRPGRRPGTTSTRPAILTAARELFAEVGYERATIRRIAARAGVNPAMVHHFYGTKDDLLVAALELPIEPEYLAEAVINHPGREGYELIRHIVAVWDQPIVKERLQLLLRLGISHERAAIALRDLLTTQLLDLLAAHMPGSDASLRAALVATQMAGLAMLRFIIPIEAVATADAETIIAAIGPTLQRYLTGTL